MVCTVHTAQHRAQSIHYVRKEPHHSSSTAVAENRKERPNNINKQKDEKKEPKDKFWTTTCCLRRCVFTIFRSDARRRDIAGDSADADIIRDASSFFLSSSFIYPVLSRRLWPYFWCLRFMALRWKLPCLYLISNKF